MSSTIQNNKQNQEKENIWIDVEPMEFDGQSESKTITSFDLAEIFNKFFNSFMTDYYGCFILPTQGQFSNGEPTIELSVYLTDKGETKDNKIKSIILNSKDVKKEGLAVRISRHNQLTSQKIYSIEEETKDIFKEFLMNGINKLEDNKHIIEQIDTGNRNMVFAKIIKLDPVKIIKKIYGVKLNDTTYDYRLSIIKVIGPNNFILKIDRLDINELNKLGNKIGYVRPSSSNILVISS